MEDCIFCKIAEKKIPADILCEDENFIAFLDIKPESKGHALVIPKKHFRWVWEVDKYDQYFQAAKKVKEILDKKYQPLFVEMKVFGVDVSHAHIHLIPHY